MISDTSWVGCTSSCVALAREGTSTTPTAHLPIGLDPDPVGRAGRLPSLVFVSRHPPRATRVTAQRCTNTPLLSPYLPFFSSSSPARPLSSPARVREHRQVPIPIPPRLSPIGSPSQRPRPPRLTRRHRPRHLLFCSVPSGPDRDSLPAQRRTASGQALSRSNKYPGSKASLPLGARAPHTPPPARQHEREREGALPA